MSEAATSAKPHYFVPQPSHWPITGSLALLLMGTGAAFWFPDQRQANGRSSSTWRAARLSPVESVSSGRPEAGCSSVPAAPM